MDGPHRPGQPFDRRRPGLPAPALGAGGGRASARSSQAKLDSAGEYIIVFTFCVWCSASYLVLETYAAVRPDVVQSRLQAILKWINTHRDEAIVFLSLALGLYLMAKALDELVSA